MAEGFAAVTEVAGARATREQLSMIQTRYAEAARRSEGRRVLEVACGAGRGLGLIAGRARMIVGGDRSFELTRQARSHYGRRVPVLQLDAQALPFRDASFDVVVFFEAIYYVPDVERCLAECRRVLAPDGELLVCSANRECAEFTSSAYAIRYYSAAELADLLRRLGFVAQTLGAFGTTPAGAKARAISLVRRAAIALHLVPRTLAGREKLKQLFYGPLTLLTAEVGEGDGVVEPLVPLDGGRATRGYKVVYVFGHLAGAAQ